MGRDERGASLRDGATNDDAVAANAARLAARNTTIIVTHARINNRGRPASDLLSDCHATARLMDT